MNADQRSQEPRNARGASIRPVFDRRHRAGAVADRARGRRHACCRVRAEARGFGLLRGRVRRHPHSPKVCGPKNLAGAMWRVAAGPTGRRRGPRSSGDDHGELVRLVPMSSRGGWMKKRVVARSPRTDRTATHRAGARPMPSGPRILSLKQVRFSILFLPAATAQAHGCQYQAAADAGAGEESTRPGFECRTPRDSITSASSWSGSSIGTWAVRPRGSFRSRQFARVTPLPPVRRLRRNRGRVQRRPGGQQLARWAWSGTQPRAVIVRAGL